MKNLVSCEIELYTMMKGPLSILSPKGKMHLLPRNALNQTIQNLMAINKLIIIKYSSGLLKQPSDQIFSRRIEQEGHSSFLYEDQVNYLVGRLDLVVGFKLNGCT